MVDKEKLEKYTLKIPIELRNEIQDYINTGKIKGFGLPSQYVLFLVQQDLAKIRNSVKSESVQEKITEETIKKKFTDFNSTFLEMIKNYEDLIKIKKELEAKITKLSENKGLKES